MERPSAGNRPPIDEELESKLASVKQVSFAICAARDPDMPIIYASSSFFDLTGYSSDEVLGKNCRFLHGPGTSRQKVLEIRNAIQEDRAVQLCILNYKKDGEAFWNHFHLAPILDSSGVVEYYIGIQTDVTQEVMAARLKQMTIEEDSPLVVSEEPSCEVAACAEQCAASQLRSLLVQWHSSHPGRCTSEVPGPVADACLPTSLLQPLMKLAQSFVLADPNKPDTPIVYASQHFLELTGYPRDQLVGRNCRFLQGPETDPAELARLREGIAAGRPTTVQLLNYRYDKKPFWNYLHVAPVRSACGKVMFLVGIQLDITAPPTGGSSAAKGAEAINGEVEKRIEPSQPSGRAVVEQKGVCGAVRVACRSLCPAGLRRSVTDQTSLRRSSDLSRRSSEVSRAPPMSPRATA